MHLLRVAPKSKWEILAVCTKSGECDLLAFMLGLDAKYHAARESLFALFKRVSNEQHGPQLLPDDRCHYVDKKEKIYQFIAGDIRLLWFYAGQDKIIICSHAFIKKSRKTPQPEIDKAISVKRSHTDSKKKNDISIITTEGRPS